MKKIELFIDEKVFEDINEAAIVNKIASQNSDSLLNQSLWRIIKAIENNETEFILKYKKDEKADKKDEIKNIITDNRKDTL